MENHIPIYLQTTEVTGRSIDDILVGQAEINGDFIFTKIHGFPLVRQFERLSELGEIQGLFVTAMLKPAEKESNAD